MSGSSKKRSRTNFDLERFYPKEYSSISKACEDGDVNKLRQLINEGKTVKTRDCRGWYPLHFAAKAGQPDCMKLLLNKGEFMNY